jgi:CDP-diacylglycerol--glycerol-3-phosphate 3-phosphatidyltransferase
MPSVYDIKPRFQNLLRPIVRRLAASGVTANQVTVAAMALSVLAGGIVAAIRPDRVLLILPVVLFVRMGLNAIDGMLAREHGQKSALGGLLNELGDVVSDIGLYLGFMPHTGMPALLVAIVLAATVGELAGVTGTMIGASRRYDGPMGKSDRALAFGVLAVVIAFWHPAAWIVEAALAIILALALLTIWNRCRKAVMEAGHA